MVKQSSINHNQRNKCTEVGDFASYEEAYVFKRAKLQEGFSRVKILITRGIYHVKCYVPTSGDQPLAFWRKKESPLTVARVVK